MQCRKGENRIKTMKMMDMDRMRRNMTTKYKTISKLYNNNNITHPRNKNNKITKTTSSNKKSNSNQNLKVIIYCLKTNNFKTISINKKSTLNKINIKSNHKNSNNSNPTIIKPS